MHKYMTGYSLIALSQNILRAFLISKVSISVPAASQYSSAKGPSIACLKLGFSPLVLDVLEASIKGLSQLTAKYLMDASKAQSTAAK